MGLMIHAPLCVTPHVGIFLYKHASTYICIHTCQGIMYTIEKTTVILWRVKRKQINKSQTKGQRNVSEVKHRCCSSKVLKSQYPCLGVHMAHKASSQFLVTLVSLRSKTFVLCKNYHSCTHTQRPQAYT